ncbi:MAG: hypothetical protein ACK5S3_10840 [Pirellulaceae bacterium]
MLDLHRVIQLFDHVDRLPRGGGVEDSIGDRYRSFAGVWNDPQTILRDGWDNHGHTGYAWAARRELFEQIGLYEAAILGNGDDLMAHGFVGELHSDCIMANYDQDQAMFRHYQKWAQKAFRYCQGDLGCMPGTVFHLWHGDHENRRYIKSPLETQAGIANGTGLSVASYLRGFVRTEKEVARCREKS